MNIKFLCLSLFCSLIINIVGSTLSAAVIPYKSISKLNLGLSLITLSIILLIAFYFSKNELSETTQIIFNVASWGRMKLYYGVTIDLLNLIMLASVNILLLLIQVYISAFRSNQLNVNQYVKYLNILNFGACLIIGANNFFQLFCGWIVVEAYCNKLNHCCLNQNEEQAADAENLLLSQRIGDLSLFLAIAAIWKNFGSLDYTMVLHSGSFNCNLLGIIAGLIAITGIAKLAQFPLHTWIVSVPQKLPVTIFMHLILKLSLGGFFMIKMSPLLKHSDYWLNIMLVVGGLTFVFAGLLAWVALDLKKIITYIIISQFSLIFIAITIEPTTFGAGYLIHGLILLELLVFTLSRIFFEVNLENNVFDFTPNIRKFSIIGLGFLWGCVILIGLPFSSSFLYKNILINHLGSISMINPHKISWMIYSGYIITGIFVTKLVYFIFFRHNHLKINEIKVSFKRVNFIVLFLLSLIFLPGILIFIPKFNEFWIKLNYRTILPLRSQCYHNTMKTYLSWIINKPILLSYLSLIIAYVFYCKQGNLARKFKLKLKKNFLFIFNLLQHEYYFNLIQHKLKLLPYKTSSILNNMIEANLNRSNITITNKIITTLSKWVDKIYKPKTNSYMYISLSGTFTIILCLTLITS